MLVYIPPIAYEELLTAIPFKSYRMYLTGGRLANVISIYAEVYPAYVRGLTVQGPF